MTACFLCKCEMMPDTSMPLCMDCVPTIDDAEDWEEQMKTCRACDVVYVDEHSCGDTTAVSVLRETLAKEVEQRQKVEQELAEVKKNLLPLAMQAAFLYNKWKQKSPKAPTYGEACKWLVNYLKGET